MTLITDELVLVVDAQIRILWSNSGLWFLGSFNETHDQ